MHTVVGREVSPMRWNRWTRVGFALLAPIVVAVMLAAGEWSQPPASAQSDPKAADGKLGPRTKAALRKYVAVPPPQVPSPADKVISQFRSSNEVRQGQ